MTKAGKFLSGKFLARNMIWSLLGTGLPLWVGVYAIPRLIEGLGVEKFGLLAIIWTGIGYFSLFDLGIGRALTKLVAERSGAGKDEDLGALIKSSLHLLLLLGILSALIVFGLTQVIMESVLQVSESLSDEAQWSLWILAGTLPFVVSTAGLIGLLQAYHRFRIISVVRIPLGVSNFLGPVLLLPYTDSLVVITAILAVTRIVAYFMYIMLCQNYYKNTKKNESFKKGDVIRELLSFGGWITVSNIVGPVMVYLDRFVISAVLGLVAVAYYTTPYEVVTRLWIIPNAIIDVLFPAFTLALVSSTAHAKRIFSNAANAQVAVMFPMVALLTLYSTDLLRIWLGEDFASNSSGILKWLSIGVYVNGFARLPFVLLQSKGRPDIPAKLHLVEMPLFVIVLWMFMQWWGVEGAAIAWAARIGVDTLLLFLFSMWKVPEVASQQYGVIAIVIVTSLMIAGTWVLEPGYQSTIAMLVIVVSSLCFLSMLIYSAWKPKRQS